MSWNHRIIRHVYDHDVADIEEFSIHEVYYDDDGKPEMVTEKAAGSYGDSVKELKENHLRMMAAFDKPVLDYSSFDTDKEEAKDGQ